MSKLFKKMKTDHRNFSTTDYDEEKMMSNAINNSIDNQTIQIYKFNENAQSKEIDFSITSDDEISTYSNFLSNNKESNKFETPNIVPTLSNVEDIFQFLSQKIAKYCQVLADLTNCEVFYKALLPLNIETISDDNLLSKNSKFKESNKTSHSLYWGTHRMLFQYSHGKGIKFSKDDGDCLIRINQRSFSNDVNNLIEEIFNEPNLACKPDSKIKNPPKVVETPQTKNFQVDKLNNEINEQEETINEIKIRDCYISLNRIDENEFDRHLFNFENLNNRINLEAKKHEYFDELNLPDEHELYSDQFQIDFERKAQKINETFFLNDFNDSIDSSISEYESERQDQKLSFVKNILDHDLKNDEEYFRCDICKNCYFRHLTQLKIHELRVHKNVTIEQTNNECPKCNTKFNENYIAFVKHLIECYFPNLYSCKTCKYQFNNYSQFLFHVKYVHANAIYMCSICGRKYKTLKQLFDHDKLIHAKGNIYCEICLEQKKTKQCLFDHYKYEHLSKNQNESELVEKSKPPMVIILDNVEAHSSTSGLNYSYLKYTNQSLKSLQTEFEDTQINLESDIENINHNKSNVHSFQKNDLIRGLIDRKHQCKWCMLRFYTKSQLKQHESTHTNSVLYCPICDKEFTHKDRLSGHMKCHMEPSLECKVCGKKFKRLCNLYNHELVHGLTEHAFMLCQFCGRGFRSRRDYQNHVIANHRDQLIKSDSQNSDPKEDFL